MTYPSRISSAGTALIWLVAVIVFVTGCKGDEPKPPPGGAGGVVYLVNPPGGHCTLNDLNNSSLPQGSKNCLAVSIQDGDFYKSACRANLKQGKQCLQDATTPCATAGTHHTCLNTCVWSEDCQPN
jgi:hypothetical protein